MEEYRFALGNNKSISEKSCSNKTLKVLNVYFTYKIVGTICEPGLFMVRMNFNNCIGKKELQNQIPDALSCAWYSFQNKKWKKKKTKKQKQVGAERVAKSSGHRLLLRFLNTSGARGNTS